MSKDDPLPNYPIAEHGSFGYEVARTTIDALASTIPGASYAAGALMQKFLASPLQKRRDEWFQKVAEGIQALQRDHPNFDPSGLTENEDFISAVYEATDAAMKTGRSQKIEMLRNGILNIASGFTIDDILRGTFFGLIDRFSPAHMHVLKLLSDPRSSPEMVQAAANVYAAAPLQTLRAAITTDVLDEAALSRVLSDLHRESLADTGGLQAMSTQAAQLQKRSTAIGDAFLEFIMPPK